MVLAPLLIQATGLYGAESLQSLALMLIEVPELVDIHLDEIVFANGIDEHLAHIGFGIGSKVLGGITVITAVGSCEQGDVALLNEVHEVQSIEPGGVVVGQGEHQAQVRLHQPVFGEDGLLGWEALLLCCDDARGQRTHFLVACQARELFNLAAILIQVCFGCNRNHAVLPTFLVFSY